MPDNPVIIAGSLSDEKLKKSIEELVASINSGMGEAATGFDTGLKNIEARLKTFSTNAKNTVGEINNAFKSMGTTFDDFAKAMEKASKAATSGGGAGSRGGTSSATVPDSIGELKAELAIQQKLIDEQKQYSKELQDQVNKVQDIKDRLDQQLKSEKQITAERARQASTQLTAIGRMPMNELGDAERRLTKLLELKNDVRKNGALLDEAKMVRLNNLIQQTINKVRELRNPPKLKDVLGMDENSVEAISRKMSALKRVQIDPRNKTEVKQLATEYQRLAEMQNKMLGRNSALKNSNLSLAQSFGYIRNRIAYALTLGAVTSFVKNIYEVRAEYELLDRSLGVLVDDFRKGSEIFQELNEMAIKSPFTLIELGTAAKQLTAYNFAAEEVVEVTRRLADISAALGVPMERLTYNLGQIKAQGVLNARDARDFANAGLAIVPMLAQMYTEQKRFGDELVTTAQVYDMMSKKMVTYKDVMDVISRITDEGGKFFDFQAKQADTLKVKMANLTLAWNNMLNEIGENEQSLLELPLKSLKILFENWKAVSTVIGEVIVVLGTYRTVAAITTALNGKMFAGGILASLQNYIKGIKSASGAMATFNAVTRANPLGLLAAALAAVVGYFVLFKDSADDATGYVERFGKAGAKTVSEAEMLFESLMGMTNGTSNYKKVMGELNSILDEYGAELVKESDGLDEINRKRQIAIDIIKQETLERKHLNDLEQGRQTYETETDEARGKLKTGLKSALTGKIWLTANDEIRQNADAITNIIADVVETNITEIAGKTGDEYEKGINKIFDIIHQRMRAIGISEATIADAWVDDALFVHNNIVSDYIGTIKDAKESQDRYTESINKAYDAEMKAAEANSTFKDKVDATSRSLMKSANDTDALYASINKIIQEYSGQNIIDFLVRVNADVPKWMMDKSVGELSQLAARFAAITKQGGRAPGMTKEETAARAALYARALQQKQANIESERTENLTKKASEALKDYKQALEGVKVAQNLVTNGQKEASLVRAKEAEEQKAYNKALEAGVSVQELYEAKHGKAKGRSGTKKDELGEALSKHIQYISELQKLYKEYKSIGMSANDALTASTKEFGKSIIANNKALEKFGIKGLDGDKLATMDLRGVRDYYQAMLDIANAKGTTKGVEELEKAIKSLNIEIAKVDYKRITDGLNSELSKLKDEYELAVELDANPELGGMFADMLGLDDEMLKNLPNTFGQLLEKANEKARQALEELKVDVKDFDLLQTNIKADDKGLWGGADISSEAIQQLIKWQATFRDMFKKNLVDTENMLDDYVKKYGGYADKIAEIEADRLNKIKQLNDAYYTEQMRQMPEYIAKLNAINKGAEREKQAVGFDEFKNSRYYTMMFENLDYVSTKTIRDIRDRLRELMDTMNELTPEQLKQVMSQYEKLEEKLVKRSPFKTLAKDFKEYIKTTKDRKAANEEFRNAQKEYDAQNKIVAAKKEEYEQAKANKNISQSRLDFIQIELNAEQDILQILKEQVDAASKKADKYNLIKKLALEELANVANVAATNLQSLGELRDFLQDDLGIELSAELNGLVDGMNKMGQGIQNIISSATSGNVVGVLTGVGQTIYGLYDGIASIFGGGSAKDKKIIKQIEASERAVKRLENTMRQLEQTASEAYGAITSGAQHAVIANKQLQLVELQRQLTLEKSRSSKKQDKDRIIELEGMINDLRNDIHNASQDIINDLLGISSAGDGITSLVQVMIDAFRNGEDAMAAFGEKWDEMIDNMILKLIVSTFMQKAWDNLMKTLDKKEEEYLAEQSQRVAEAQAEYDKTMNMSDDEIRKMIATQRWGAYAASDVALFGSKGASWKTITQSEVDAYRKAIESAFATSTDNLNDASLDFTKWAIDYMSTDGREYMENWASMLEESLGDWYAFGDKAAGNNLSALSAGIQNITETTANSIEAYLNGVSQQVYYQSDILTEIRDTLLLLNLDVSTSINSQILLQLQSSYNIQQSIQGILEGWSNASGQAVRVELMN